MYSSRSERVILVGLSFVFLLSACNYPGIKPNIRQLSARELRQTLDAQSGGTAELETATPLLETITPESQFTAQPIRTFTGNLGNDRYLAQSGDTLPALVGRFRVEPQDITSELQIPEKTLIPFGQPLIISNWVKTSSYPDPVLPDSEVINSPTTLDFDIDRTISQAGGYLSQYKELVQGEQLSGAEIVQRVALESSVNPRFLLALLELRSGWVRGLPGARPGEKYPIGFHVSGWEGLYKELVITATHLNAGYYGWREGSLGQLQFQDGRMAQTSPELNAGSIAVQSLLAKLYPQDEWQTALYGPQGFLEIYQEMFGDPWSTGCSTWPALPGWHLPARAGIAFYPRRTLEPDRWSAPILEDWQPARGARSGSGYWRKAVRGFACLGAGFCSRVGGPL